MGCAEWIVPSSLYVNPCSVAPGVVYDSGGFCFKISDRLIVPGHGAGISGSGCAVAGGS